MSSFAMDPELAARALLGRASSYSAPLDLVGLARDLGVEIREIDLPYDGQLRVEGERAEILLSTNRPWRRRRFTIAHELGHFWLHRYGGGPHPGGPQAEEDFCDAFAAELLMPRHIMEARVSADAPEDLSTIQGVANELETSLAATVVRLAHVRGWRSSLLQWQGGFGHWELHGLTRVPPALRAELATTPLTRTALDLRVASDIARLRLPLKIQDQDRWVPAQVLGTGRGAIALVDLGSAQPQHDLPGPERAHRAWRKQATVRYATRSRGRAPSFNMMMYGQGDPLVRNVGLCLTLLGCETRRAMSPGIDFILKDGEATAVVQVKAFQGTPAVSDLEGFAMVVESQARQGESRPRAVFAVNATRHRPPSDRPEPFSAGLMQMARDLQTILLSTTRLVELVIAISGRSHGKRVLNSGPYVAPRTESS